MIELLAMLIAVWAPAAPPSQQGAPTYVALRTSTTYPLPPPVDGVVTLSLSSGATIRLRATDIDYERSAAYTNRAVVKAETTSQMTDKTSGRRYLNMTFSARVVATAWLDDVDYDEMRSGFAIFHARAAAASGLTGAAAIDDTQVQAKCTRDWPDDFRMRAYCATQQVEAIAELRARSMMTSGDRLTVRTKCAKDWPDDFRMRNYCEEQQLKYIR